jgi:farnesol dehydrogenase
MRFAITGANGLIGKALAMRLVSEGHEVHALFRSQEPEVFKQTEGIRSFQGDILHRNDLLKAFSGCDGVFHIAAFAKPWAKDKQAYYTINEQGTINVCNAALECGVKRVVYTSSAGTHGAQKGTELINEDTWPVTYHTDYEQSKFNGRTAALSYIEKDLEVTVVSPARVYAPIDPSDSNVPRRMTKIYFERKLGVVPANGLGVGSYVFIDDIVDGHVIAMLKAPSGEEYLLGGDNLSYLEFFDVLAKVSGIKHPVIKIPYQLSLGIGKVQHFAAETIGIKPTITTPWVRRYTQNWGIDSSKIGALGYRPTAAEIGFERLIQEFI